MSILDAVQRRVPQLIGAPASTCYLQPLSHRELERQTHPRPLKRRTCTHLSLLLSRLLNRLARSCVLSVKRCTGCLLMRSSRSSTSFALSTFSMNLSIRSLQDMCSSGSQLLSAEPYPFQLTRNSFVPSHAVFLCKQKVFNLLFTNNLQSLSHNIENKPLYLKEVSSIFTLLLEYINK
nr:unnamed protein product [Callosobruchus chinensis]